MSGGGLMGWRGSGGRAAGPRNARAGFTLLEMVIAIVILTVSVGGMLASVLSSGKLEAGRTERELPIRAAESQIETLQGVDFATVFATFNRRTFAVEGLDPQEGAAAVGAFEFPTVGNQLREDVDDAGLGMPRDLSGDGVVDGADHSGTYQILPVRVRVAWRGSAGESQVVLETYLCDWGG